MTGNTPGKTQRRPIKAALEVLGAAWALLVLRDVAFGNRRRFRELLAKSEEGNASNIPAGRLEHLVASPGPLHPPPWTFTHSAVPVFAAYAVAWARTRRT